MTTAKKYYESKMSFQDGNAYSSGELYGSEVDFWQDVEDGKIIYIEDIQVAIENNIDLYEN